MRVRLLGGRHNVVHRCPGRSVGNVLANRAPEEPGVLKHHAKERAKVLSAHVAGVVAVNQDLTGVHVIEAQALKTGACDTIEEARKRFGGSDDGNPGYVVKYPDGYISWSPKDVFEKSYMQVQENPKLISGVSIGEHMVNDFISYIETSTVGYKTTMVRCVLRNGFEIIETSACVDARNYDQKLGEEICMKKIKDKIWYLLGFLLQTAWHGIK